MTQSSFTPRAYLRVGCPFSFKFLLFMSEAGLLQHIEVIRCDPQAEDFERIRQTLAQGLGGKASFPAVEIEPGVFRADSDRLIEYFAQKYGVDAARLPALVFYRESIFPQLLERHKA